MKRSNVTEVFMLLLTIDRLLTQNTYFYYVAIGLCSYCSATTSSVCW
jgi:hypothetical protein